MNDRMKSYDGYVHSGDDSLPPSRFDIKKSFFVVVDVVVELLFLLPIYREK
jgi:hypothetical protein